VPEGVDSSAPFFAGGTGGHAAHREYRDATPGQEAAERPKTGRTTAKNEREQNAPALAF